MLSVSQDNESATTKNKYLEWLIDRTLYIDVKGTAEVGGQVDLKLSNVYIPLNVQHNSQLDIASQDRQERLQEEIHLIEGEGLTQKVNLSLLENILGESEEIIEVAEAVNRFDHLVLLGDPGSGKTTLLHYLAHQYAQALLSRSTEPQTVPDMLVFPILLRIADYAEHGLPQNQTLNNFLAQDCIKHHCPAAGLDDLLAAALTQETCLILLDGLDEVLDTEMHSRVVEQIDFFVNSYAHRPHRFLITSRPTGYSTYPLGAPFVHYRLCDMNESQIRQFLESWCLAVEATQAPELSASARRTKARHEVEGILRAVQTSPGVQHLARNPLMLRIIALIHREVDKLPRKRVKLYEQATTTLTQTWRAQPSLGETQLTMMEDVYFDPLLSYLAFWIHMHRLEGQVTEEEIHQVLREEWLRIKETISEEDEPAFAQEVSAFLRRVRDRAGLLVERAPSRYSFLHLSFQEYYAGRYLVSDSRKRARRIYELRHKPRWEEPILLGLGFVGLTSLNDASALLETAILAQGEEAEAWGFTPSPNEEILGRDYLFALRCLGEQIPVRPSLERQLIERFINELIYQKGFAKFQLYHQLLWQRLEGLKTSRVGQDSISKLTQVLSNGSTKERLNAIQAIERLGFVSDRVISELSRALYSGELEVCRQAALCLAHLGGEKALRILVEAMDHRVAEDLVRRTAVESLGQVKLPSSELIDILLAALSDKDPGVQYRSAESLGQMNPSKDKLDKVVKALMKALRSTNIELSYAAARSLGRLGYVSDEVVNALIDTALSNVLLTKGSRAVKSDMRLAAIQSLGQLGQASDRARSANALLIVFDHFRYRQRPELRRAAAQSLGQLGLATDEVVHALLKALNSSYPLVRNAAAESLGMIKPRSEKVIYQLLKRRRNEFTWVYATQIESLGKLGQVPKDVVKALLGLLGHESPQLRRAAGQSLKQLGQTSEQIVSDLLQFLGDHHSDPELRLAAVQSLGQLGQTLKGQTLKQIHQAFLKALEGDVPALRFAVARALPRLHNSNIPDAVKTVLQEFLQDDNLGTRYHAAEGLVRLERISDQVTEVLIEVLQNAEAPLRRDAAILLGEKGLDEERVTEALWRGFCHTEGYVRSACAVGLAHLARRFPSRAEYIASSLKEFIEDENRDMEIDPKTGRSIRDYAFEALWLLQSEMAATG